MSIPTPFLSLLRSRKVIVAVVSLLVSLLVSIVPELEVVRGELIIFVATIALAVIGGIAYEDGARIARDRADDPVQNPEQYAREIVLAVLDEVLPRAEVEETTRDEQ